MNDLRILWSVVTDLLHFMVVEHPVMAAANVLVALALATILFFA